MTSIIEVKNLSKKYKIGEQQPYLTLRDSLANLAKNPFKKIKEGLNKDEFWALKDINFTVEPGEVIGIIGRNGAGKSTLLKILSRITPPTTGEIILQGRVGSLLEVGTGFQQELTGRENIFLNGAILGMSQREIKRKFDEIVDFAEVEKFIDTPVKHYSSGMYMRLAFSIAAHLDPEILIVDEVLAVGDAEFQNKCLGKMDQVSKKEGRTVLFVSHNLTAIKSLCSKVIVLNQGKLLSDSGIDQQINSYLIGQNVQTAKTVDIIDYHISKVVVDPSTLVSSEPTQINFELYAKNEIVINDLAIVVTNSMTRMALLDFRSQTPYKIPKNHKIALSCHVSSLPFVEGTYDIMLYVRHNHEFENHFQNICQLQILPSKSKSGIVKYEGVNRGYVDLPYKFTTRIN